MKLANPIQVELVIGQGLGGRDPVDFKKCTLKSIVDDGGEFGIRVKAQGKELVEAGDISCEDSSGTTTMRFLRSMVKAGLMEVTIQNMKVPTEAFISGEFTLKKPAPPKPFDPFAL